MSDYISFERKVRCSWFVLLATYKELLRSRLFVGYSLTIGFSWFNFFLFTVVSPLFFQKTLAFSVVDYGVLFSLTVSGYAVGALLTRILANRLGWSFCILSACVLSIFGALLMVVFTLLGPHFWASVIFPMVMIMFSMGVIIPCTQASVLQPYEKIAATASGLFFFIQMLFGCLAGLIAPLFNAREPVVLAVVMLLASIVMLLVFGVLICRWNFSKPFRRIIIH